MSDDTKLSEPPHRRVATASAPTQRVSVHDLDAAAEAVRTSGGSFAARYRERGLLGRGGMGEVRLVEDRLLGREIALKLIAPSLEGSRGARERFLREVRVQGQLEHPAVVPVYDLGVDAEGNEYFTMKRIGGRTLASIVRGLATGDEALVSEWPRNALLGVFRQVCLAIAYAHARGVVHRDLKPANVMVGDFGEVYVLDWGIARLLAEPSDAADETLLGTPGYMSPEQSADPASIDARADVYALGAILFELLALEPWHRGNTVEDKLASAQTQRDARPAERAPQRDIPPELDDLCARAGAFDRAARIQTARELAEAVERYLEGDRDLERRRELAARHAQAASAARARATGGGADALAARREALRESGRAVALDPENHECMRAAVELVLEPPPEIPDDVQHELERAQSDRIRAGIVPGIAVFASFMLCALVLPLSAGVISWRLPVLIAASLAIACVSALYRLRVPNLARESRGALVTVTSVSVGIALTAGYLGPMMLIPALAVALGNALVASQLKWRAVLAFGVLSVVVPFAAEWAGVVERSYEFGPDGMLVRPVVMHLSEHAVRVTSLVVTLGALVGSVLYVRRVINVESELRQRWVLHNWHLRQLAQI